MIFNYIPMGGIVLAFKKFSARKGIWGSPWAGTRYFDQLFNSPTFTMILTNTLILSAMSLLIGFPFPILLALAFNEIHNARVKKTLQTITFAPYFISTVVMVSIIFQVFSYHYGLVNAAIKAFGGTAINWFALPNFFRPVYVFSGIWQGAGYSSIIYMAALAGVDPTLYEAADIDGASRFQRMMHIDLPSISSVVVITLIMNTGSLLSVGFEKAFLLQNDLNYRVSEIISTYVYKVGIEQSQYSFSTAVNLFNSVVNCFMLLIVNYIAGRIGGESMF
ncbi:MAG: ABC transporter permease [Christensenellales bacterium]